MKGKGKGEKSDLKECPLQFPDLSPLDHTRACPRYTSVLGRTDEDGVVPEELDMLQTEMENLLASVAKRIRLMQSEIDILNNSQDKIGKVADKKGGKVETSSSPNGKRIGKVEEKSNKKFKESSGKATVTLASKPKGKVQQAKVPDFDFPESPSLKPPEIPKVPKNETPNRFWAMVEPYCAEIQLDDMKVLEDIIKAHEEETEPIRIPNLGKHYSERWAHEDMLEEKKEGMKSNDKRRSGGSGSSVGDASSLMKRLDGRVEDASPFGPLTQRLVQALIEENIMTPLDDTNISEADAAVAATISPRSLAKQLNIGYTTALEKRIKRELEENGILEVEEKPKDDPDDEILTELKKKQMELKGLIQHNLMITRRLHKLAKDETHRQELRKKMAAAETEVMDAFRRIQASKAKKKTPTKKEKDLAMRALKERESIVKQLDGLS